jgi:hypothetical protein
MRQKELKQQNKRQLSVKSLSSLLPLYYWIAVTYKICVRIKKNIRNALIPL